MEVTQNGDVVFGTLYTVEKTTITINIMGDLIINSDFIVKNTETSMKLQNIIVNQNGYL